MSTNPGNTTKKFKHFLEFPPEIRMEVIDSMEANDRIRFTRCSQLSCAEAMRSKSYIYGLGFLGFDNNFLRINVLFEDKHKVNRKKASCGFILDFTVEKDIKYCKYSNLQLDELWRIQLCSSIDLIQFAVEHFKSMLKSNQNKIKELDIYYGSFLRSKLRDYDFEVQSLRNLEVLKIRQNSAAPHFLSKLRKPLKKLFLTGRKNENKLIKYEWSSVQEFIMAPFIRLNYEQFRQLATPHARINIGELTEMDVYNYIKLWQNGKTGKAWEWYEWALKGSNFDILKLLELLGTKEPESEKVELLIKHNLEEGKTAVLYCDYHNITFRTNK